MPRSGAVRSLRIRYIVALAVIAMLVTSSWAVMQIVISSQENYSRLVTIASLQKGLASRIVHSATIMATTRFEDEFDEARAQLGRARHGMAFAHETLLNGDPERNIPKVMTPALEIIYFDKKVGLDGALKRFLVNAKALSNATFGDLQLNTAEYVYLTTFGPHGLERMLNIAADEYATFAHKSIKRTEYFETVIWIAALLALLLEVVFVFRPLEGRVEAALEKIETKNRQLGVTIGELEDAQQQLQVEKMAAEEANEAKGQFLANMGHELRTPLNAIIGFSDIMAARLHGPLDRPEYDEYIHDIGHSGRQLLGIINDILDLSKIESREVELQETAISVPELVDSCLSLMAERAASAGVTLTKDVPTGLAPLHADERVVKQTLINLLSNAVKFTPEGGQARITARCPANSGHEFEITDTGIGIADEDIPVALTPFKQVNNNLDRQFDGTGLGLPLSKSFVELHGGRFEMQSETGVGTKITVRFPAYRVGLDNASVA